TGNTKRAGRANDRPPRPSRSAAGGRHLPVVTAPPMPMSFSGPLSRESGGRSLTRFGSGCFDSEQADSATHTARAARARQDVRSIVASDRGSLEPHDLAVAVAAQGDVDAGPVQVRGDVPHRPVREQDVD